MPFPVFDRPPVRRPNGPDPYVFADHLGEPIPIFLHKDLGTRDALAQIVTAGGGELAQTMRQSVFLIVDPMSSDGQDTIDGYGDRPDKRVLRPEWLHMCAAAGRIVIANDWGGCRLGRGPPTPARKRPAEGDQFDGTSGTNPPAAKQPRTDAPVPIPQQQPAPISYTYNPAYPLVPGYYPPPPSTSIAVPYSYYESTSAPQGGPGQGVIKKRTPRPPRQPNRPWSLEENIALYNFMVAHPAPTEREQATLVRRWAKETRPDRGRQSWVAHAFATSFKNWVKEYEAGNINANPADFGPSADADGEADPDQDHEETPPTSTDFVQPPVGPSEFVQQPGNSADFAHTQQPDYSQFAASPYLSASEQQQGTPQYTTTPPNPPPSAPGFSQFNVPQEATPSTTGDEPRKDPSSAEGTNAEPTPNPVAGAGFPPLYPLVYPPVEEDQQAKEGGGS
ncbi:BRCA1 carboxy-terminus (BRCT) domain protein [Ceratobasidium sp. AG-Ba]|nr:BRCA1 carboxy-terminus (BRCT) domain protein [Ceratobasidium sp. AG-Ba]